MISGRIYWDDDSNPSDPGWVVSWDGGNSPLCGEVGTDPGAEDDDLLNEVDSLLTTPLGLVCEIDRSGAPDPSFNR